MACALAAGLLASCHPAEPPPRQPTEVGVEVTRLTEYAPEIVLTGDVAAKVVSELSFRVGGRITERKAEVGDHVGPNQVLARIDPQEQQANVEAARAGVQAAEARLRQATSTLERQKALIGKGYTTRREYDQAQEGFQSAEGALNLARAQLGTAQDQLSQTNLTAGVAGVITARNAEAGQVVQAAQSVFTLAQDGPRDAVFNVYESIFTHEPAGNTIRLTLLSDPKVTATARLREVSPTVDPGSGTVKVKFEIIRPPPAMTLGAPVTGAARLKPRRVIVLPWSALSEKDGKPAVWIVDPAGKTVSLVPIVIDAYQVRIIVVRSGLEPGQMVVTRGQQLLRPGQVVAPIEDKQPEAQR